MHSIITNKPFMYGDYAYPWYGQLIGWVMAASSVMWIPLYAVYKIVTNKGKLEDVCIGKLRKVVLGIFYLMNFLKILKLSEIEMLKLNKLNQLSETYCEAEAENLMI